MELPPDGLAARLGLRRALSALPAHQLGAHEGVPWTDDERLRDLVAALLAVAGRPDEARGPITAGAARALWHLAHGVDRVRGGRAGLAELAGEKVRAGGGAWDARRPVTGFEVKRRRVAAVVSADERRYTAEVIVFAGDDATLNRLVGEPLVRAPVLSTQVASATVPAALRPRGLRDPCGWLPERDAAPCLVRVSGDELSLCWSGDPPALERLVPFGGAKPGAAEPRVLPGPGAADPLGLFRVPVRGPLRNLVRVGPWVVRGLGLEGDFLSAWQAAQVAVRLAPRRRLLGLP
jgi:phytoene dehydrogenase-like protein